MDNGPYFCILSPWGLVKVKALTLNKCLRFMGLGMIKISPRINRVRFIKIGYGPKNKDLAPAHFKIWYLFILWPFGL